MEDYFAKFRETGKIEDYLKYRAELNKEQVNDDKKGRNSNKSD